MKYIYIYYIKKLGGWHIAILASEQVLKYLAEIVPKRKGLFSSMTWRVSSREIYDSKSLIIKNITTIFPSTC